MDDATPKPRMIAIELTRRCNLRCAHCRASSSAFCAADELSRGELDGIFKDVASFAASSVCILTGGEPLLRDDLSDIVALAVEKGLKPVVGTNGTLLSPTKAKELFSAGVRRISVSIDFPTEREHDAFRGVEGAFKAAIAGVANAIDAGIDVQINTSITKRNRALVPEIHDLAVRLGAKAFHPFILVPTGRGAGLADEVLSAAENEETLRLVCEMAKTSPLFLKPTDAPQYKRIEIECGIAHKGPHFSRGCLAGTAFAFIGSNGDVKPCGFFDISLGNVRNVGFSKIWRDDPVLDDLRHPERQKGKCSRCGYIGVCGGCRARALAMKGDYLAEEPLCPYLPDGDVAKILRASAFPLRRSPYAALAKSAGVDGDALWEGVLRLARKGVLVGIGGVFEPRRIGRVTTLVALKVEASALESVAAAVNAESGVSHNYARGGEYNLWFTLSARGEEELRNAISRIASLSGVVAALDLPADEVFKLRGPWQGGETPARKMPCESRPFDESDPFDLAVAQFAESDIVSAGREPFECAAREISAKLGRSVAADEVAGRIGELVSDGTIRRFGAFFSHVRIGYSANALLLWRLDDSKIGRVAQKFAAFDFVSHLYRRRAYANWPYTLYSMVHATSKDRLAQLCGEMESAAQEAVGGAVEWISLPTEKEFKKVRPRYF